MASLLAADNGLRLDTMDDAMDILVCGLPGCVLTLEDVADDLFDLKNGQLGDILQKFTNYRWRVAFVIPPDHGLGDRITELMRDHARHPCIRFFATTADAVAWLA